MSGRWPLGIAGGLFLGFYPRLVWRRAFGAWDEAGLLQWALEDLELEPLVEFLAGFWEQAYLLEAEFAVQGF
jgi:hypothetical protein